MEKLLTQKNICVYLCLSVFFINFFLLSTRQSLAQQEQQQAQEPEEAQEEIVWPQHSEADVQDEQAQGAAADASTHESRLKEVVSVNFKDMDLKQALSILAENYNLNILAGDEVKGTITINFKDVPLQDVLTQMLKLKNFTYKWEGNIIKVVSAEEGIETRTFTINHASLDLASEVIAGQLSKEGKSKINTSTNQLIVTDTLPKLDEIDKILKDIDIPPAQVRLETKIIDITHEDLDNLGLKLETSNLRQKIPSRIGGLTLESGKHKSKMHITDTDYTNEGTSSTLTGGQFVLGFEQAGSTITATIDALIQHKKARVLASPSLTTLNNVEARINIGTKYPIREQTQTSTGTLETTRFVDVGTTLKVTPKINEDGTIQLTIHPEVSSVSSTVDAGPVITTREADTTVIVRDGETLILAGLLQLEDDRNRSRVPFLGSLPIIGLLFRSRDTDKTQKELAIFITPHILNRAVKDSYVAKQGMPSEIGLAGERIDASEMFSKAEDLESGESLQMKYFSTNVRLTEAAKNYEMVALMYPGNYYADIALFRAGQLYEYRLKELSAALSVYQRLVSNYPNSSYLKDAKKRVNKLNRLLAKKK